MSLVKPLNHKRMILFSSLSVLILICWFYMLFIMSMNMEPVSKWDGFDITMLFLMWSIMMVGMMLPSALPVIKLIEQLNQKRAERNSPYVKTGLFIAGYIVAWIVFSVLITLIQWWLHYISVMTPMMVSGNVWFTSAVLMSAGIYQWLPIKQKCLTHCRSPLGFLMKEWKEGTVNAVFLGLKHGLYCLGCCWFLMGLLFVAGVMNILWIFILSLVVIIEKTAPQGEILSKILGVGLVIYAGTLIFTPA